MLDSRAHGNGVHRAVAIIMALLVVPIAAAITLDVHAPESVKEGELLIVNFTVSGATGQVNKSIYRNGALVMNGSEFLWPTTNSDSGTYIFRFVANTINGSAEEQRTVEVLDNPLDVRINNPQAGVITNDELRISAETGLDADSCTYDLDGNTGSLTESGDEWYKVLLLGQDKVYDLTVECTKGNDTRDASVIFILDTTQPSITSKSPDGSFTGTPIPIEIETNENSKCRHSKQDVAYGSMQSFSQTGGTEHKQIVEESQGDVTYYVACEDRHSNTMPENEEITFFANLKPTAIVDIDDEGHDTLRPGTYEVNVMTSEPVIKPTLQYEFSNERKKIDISLEGQGTTWEGFIAIGEDIENDVGTFYFSAKDMTDLEGSEIKSGKIFLVDTEPPDEIESLKVTREGIDAKLEWAYEGEPADHFEIYRGTEPGLERLDKWDETQDDEYIDQNVLLGKRYYYAVAAVDKAGNIGLMSEEKKIDIEVEETLEADPVVIAKLNNTKELLQSKVFDIDQAIRNLESQNDRIKLEVIDRLNLLENARKAKNGIETLISEIDKLKLVGLTEKDADKRIEVFLNNADTQFKDVAKDIIIGDNVRQDQALLEEELEEAINHVVVGLKLDQESRQAYSQQMRNLQDRTTITSEAITTKVYYMDRPAPRELTLIHKHILTEVPIADAVIVEMIDKGVAARDKDVTFEEEPTVLQPDPIVKWEENTLTSKDVYYRVEKIADMTGVRASKTVLLQKPSIEKDNEVTGNVAKETESEDSGLMQLLVFLGLIMTAGLLVYYVAYVKEEEVHPSHSIVPQRTVIHPPEAIHIYREVKKGHASADQVKYDEALNTYRQIMAQMEKGVGLEKKYREKINKELKELYMKLQLMLNLERAHHAVDTKDVKNLKDIMAEIKKSYHEMEETELAEHVRKNYSYFITHMKGMDREEFFRNMEL